MSRREVTSTVKFDERPIPKRLFFIAIGPIPTEYFLTMCKVGKFLSEKAPEFEVEIFVDNEKNIVNASVRDLDRLPGIDRGGNFNIHNLKVKNISQIIDGMQRDRPSKEREGFYSEQEVKILTRQIYCDMVGLRNLAAVSDLLRYEKLRQDGGYYLDWEVLLKEGLGEVETDYGFKYIGFLDRGWAQGNNDIIGAVKDHPILGELLKESVREYLDLVKKSISSAPKISGGDHFTYDDAKRSSYFSQYLKERPYQEDSRLEMTKVISGPALLNRTVTQFLKDESGRVQESQKFFFPQSTLSLGAEFCRVAGFSAFYRQQALSWVKVDRDHSSFDNEFRGDNPKHIAKHAVASNLSRDNIQEKDGRK